MKLAEALNLRADLQKRIAGLREIDSECKGSGRGYTLRKPK